LTQTQYEKLFSIFYQTFHYRSESWTHSCVVDEVTSAMAYGILKQFYRSFGLISLLSLLTVSFCGFLAHFLYTWSLFVTRHF